METFLQGVHQGERSQAGSFAFLGDCHPPQKSYTHVPILACPLRHFGWELFELKLSAGQRVIGQNCLGIFFGRDNENRCQSSSHILRGLVSKVSVEGGISARKSRPVVIAERLDVVSTLICDNSG